MSYSKKVLKLYYTDGGSDKEYHAIVEASGTGYVVYGLYGRRGAARTKASKVSTPTTLGSAETAWRGLVDEKSKKGYTTDASGTPHTGVAWSSAVTTGTAPAPAAAPAGTAPTITAAMWLGLASDEELEVMLEDTSYALQAVPRVGERVLVTVWGASVEAVSTSSMAKVGFPAKLKKELAAHASNTVLDGFYDAASGALVVLDGFQLPAAHATDGFVVRHGELSRKLAKATAAVLSMQPVYRQADEKSEALWLMRESGHRQALLKHLSKGYQGGMVPRKDAGVFAHAL